MSDISRHSASLAERGLDSALTLSIESSCDETSVAVTRGGRSLISNVVASQASVHALYGGVVPEIASRAHTEAISALTDSALEKAGITIADVDSIAVTNTPGLIGALLVGTNFAKGLAYSAKKPLCAVNHIKGHVAANYLVHPDLKPPFIALVVSGGHTSLFYVKSYTDYITIGQTRDDAAGEAFDKAARVLGLPYPGGAAMDKMAGEGDKKRIKFSISHIDGSKYDFSFSGLKTAVINYVNTANQKGETLDYSHKCDIAASLTDALIRTVTSRLEMFLTEDNTEGLPIALAGGVAANSHLRAALSVLAEKHGTKLFMPPLSLCGDNAAMIGAQGFYEPALDNNSFLQLNAFATARVTLK